METTRGAPPLTQLLQALQHELQGLRDEDLFRQFAVVQARRGMAIRIDDRWGVCFSSNDYLGLSIDPAVIRAAAEAAHEWGAGAGASRLLAGTTRWHRALEAALAGWFGAEDAIVYSSGYLTNLGALQALLGPEDLVAVDRLAHASLVEACRTSRAKLAVFRHGDLEQLGELLGRSAGRRRRIIVTEGVFSMDGDETPLAELLRVAAEHEAVVYLDDAHAVFAVGATGRGTPERCGVPHQAMIYMGALGKALGCQGGFVVGPTALIDTLRNRAKSFIYTTALATPIAAAAHAALQRAREDSQPRQQLDRHARRLHERLRAHGLIPDRPPSHILPIVLGASSRAQAVARELWTRGIFAPAIRPPTVPEGTARLRISLSALHTDEQLQQLADALAAVLPANQVRSAR